MCININVIVISVKNACDLHLSTKKHIILGYPKVIPYIKFEHFGIIHLSYADRQKNQQTEPNILPTPTDSVSVDKNKKL